MKKLGIFIFLVMLLLLYQINGFTIITKDFDGKYSSIFVNEKISEEYNKDFDEIFIEKISKGNASSESIKFLGSEKDIQYFINTTDMKIIDEQNLANIKVIYGYSPRFKDFVVINGERINVQIAQRGRTITIGLPLINGSY